MTLNNLLSFDVAKYRTIFVAFALALSSGLALADEGHDHGDAAPAAAGSASPRLDAHSDLFELVGVVEKGQMTIYLDRFATNEPITGAKIEYEAGADKGVAAAQADGTYLVKFDALTKPGQLPFSFTVTAGSDTDLLTAELATADPHEHEEESGPAWSRWLPYAAGAALAAVVLTFLLARRRRAARLNPLNG